MSIILEIFKETFESLIICTFRKNVKDISVEDLFALVLVLPIYICWPFISRERESTVFHVSYFVMSSSQFAGYAWNHQGFAVTNTKGSSNTGYTQKNGAVSKGNKEFISNFSRAQCTPSAAETVQVSHALPAVRFSCLMRGHGASFQDGVAAGKGFLCAPFRGVQICDYSAAWVSCTV